MKTLTSVFVLVTAGCAVATATAAVWKAHLPGGTIATAVPTAWGVSISYSDYPAAASTSITGRTTYTVTTREAEAPLTLSLMNGENWDWVNALDNHWIEFSAAGLDGVTRAAEFYPERHTGDVAKAMYSGDAAARAARVIPESRGWAWAAAPLALLACMRGLRRLAFQTT